MPNYFYRTLYTSFYQLLRFSEAVTSSTDKPTLHLLFSVPNAAERRMRSWPEARTMLPTWGSLLASPRSSPFEPCQTRRSLFYGGRRLGKGGKTAITLRSTVQYDNDNYVN